MFGDSFDNVSDVTMCAQHTLNISKTTALNRLSKKLLKELDGPSSDPATD